MVTSFTPAQLLQILQNITHTVASFDNTANKMQVRIDKTRTCNGIAPDNLKYQHHSLSGSVGWDTPYFEQHNVANIEITWSDAPITRYVVPGASYIVPRCYGHTSTNTLSTDTTYAVATFSYPYPPEGDSTYIQDYLDSVVADPSKINTNPPLRTILKCKQYSIGSRPVYLNDLGQHKTPIYYPKYR